MVHHLDYFLHLRDVVGTALAAAVVEVVGDQEVEEEAEVVGVEVDGAADLGALGWMIEHNSNFRKRSKSIPRIKLQSQI